MKKILYIIMLLPIVAMAQSNDQNWIKSKTYKVPTATSIEVPTTAEAVVQVNYYDGLGRPIQQIAHAQSNSGKDIVTHLEYDAFGRVEKEFLPFIASGAASLNIKTNEVVSFYGSNNPSLTGNPNFEITQYPYSKKQFEASPLDRVLKQAAPGDAWYLGGGKEIKFDYLTNVANEVKKYKATANWDANIGLYEIVLNEDGNYGLNELYKSITYDENSPGGTSKIGRTEEFKNKEGQVVLKRTFNNNDEYDTYYVYDQFGNLTYVIPPAVDENVTPSVLDDVCYQYKYDYKNRLVEKKLPGKHWEFIVYDKLDRVVATGPAFNPYGTSVNGWLITKYDIFNRPVYTGWINSAALTTADRKALQSDYNLVEDIYSESKTTSTITIDGTATNYTNQVTPNTFILLTVTYYDDYNYPNAPTIPSKIEFQDPATVVKGLTTGTWVRVLDSPNSVTNETSYTIYDDRFRPIRIFTKNYLNGYTQVDSKLDWSGKTIYTISKHKRTLNGIEIVTKDSFEYSAQDRLTKHYHKIDSDSEQLLALNTYDELGQLINKKVGGSDIAGANAFQNVDYSYNIRGWLKSINDVSDLTPSITENDLFAFKINYNQLESGSNTIGLFNGNIAETLWRTEADDIKRKYEYHYDNLNRLIEANYSKPDAPETLDNYLEKATYDKNGNILTLERNGNIDPSGGSTVNQIDNLVYTYDVDKINELRKVNDFSNSPQGFNQNNDIAIGDIDENNKDLSEDYTYDFNGNLKTDVNKGIKEINYNHLNLPTNITFEGVQNGAISYIYNAIGQKIKKVTYGDVSLTTEYLCGYQYDNAILQFFPHAEGYVRSVGITDRRGTVVSYQFSYVFNYTDHLGNIRVSYALDPADLSSLKILEENHYYPFGLKHQNYNVNKLDFENFPETGVEIVYSDNPMYKYKYNGKELQDELGLNVYDLGARNYDPSIGRFFNYDPLAEKYAFQSAYAISINNPVYNIDINGEGVDNEYNFNVSTGSLEQVSDKGGNETDYINWIGEDSDGNTVNIFTEERAVEHTKENIRTGSEIGFTSYARMAGEFRTINYLPTPGGLQDPSAEIFASWAGGKVLGAVLGNVLGRIFGGYGDEAVAATEAAATDVSASTPVGRIGSPMIVKDGTNLPAVINGQSYSGHALDKMQRSGLTPSVVQDVIKNPIRAVTGNTPGTIESYGSGLKVVTNKTTGNIITVMPKTH